MIDVSLSIAEANYIDVRRTLRQLIRIDAPVGLVFFSDIPYELLPPGTPASELEPLLGVLQPSKSKAAPPINPWWDSYRAGTRISAAMELARDMLERDKVEDGFIVLVSDLETAPDDVQATTRVLQDIQRSSIDMRVVPMSASSDSLRLFEGMLGPKAFAALPKVDRAKSGASRMHSAPACRRGCSYSAACSSRCSRFTSSSRDGWGCPA